MIKRDDHEMSGKEGERKRERKREGLTSFSFALCGPGFFFLYGGTATFLACSDSGITVILMGAD